MNNLAMLYRDQGRYDEAEALLFNSIETRRRVLGAEHPDTLNSMANLALLLRRRGRYDEAEVLQVEALDGLRRVLGEDHPDTLTSMNSMGGILIKQGRYEEAGAIIRQSLDARVRVLGADHSDVGYSHYNLACLSAALGKRAESLTHLRNAATLNWAEDDILTNSELDVLRGNPEFEEIVADVKKRIGER